MIGLCIVAGAVTAALLAKQAKHDAYRRKSIRDDEANFGWVDRMLEDYERKGRR